MSADNRSPVFVFIDESGNFDFSERGTEHFVLSAFATDTPTSCSSDLANLTYELLARDLSAQLPFHASDNSLGIRKRVLASLCRQGDGCFSHSIGLNKSELPAGFKRPEALYLKMGALLVDRICGRIDGPNRPIVLMFDAALPARHRAAFTQSIKSSMKSLNKRFVVAIRPVKHDLNGQAADFIAWAVFRLLERNDVEWADSLPGDHIFEFIELK